MNNHNRSPGSRRSVDGERPPQDFARRPARSYLQAPRRRRIRPVTVHAAGLHEVRHRDELGTTKNSSGAEIGCYEGLRTARRPGRRLYGGRLAFTHQKRTCLFIMWPGRRTVEAIPAAHGVANDAKRSLKVHDQGRALVNAGPHWGIPPGFAAAA